MCNRSSDHLWCRTRSKIKSGACCNTAMSKNSKIRFKYVAVGKRRAAKKLSSLFLTLWTEPNQSVTAVTIKLQVMWSCSDVFSLHEESEHYAVLHATLERTCCQWHKMLFRWGGPRTQPTGALLLWFNLRRGVELSVVMWVSKHSVHCHF